MEDSRVSLKKSLTQSLKHSIEMVSLRASAIVEGKPYTNLNDSDKGKQEEERRAPVQTSSSSRNSSSNSGGGGGISGDDQQRKVQDSKTTLQLCEILSSASLVVVTDSAADELLRRVEMDASECLLTLRCNAYWPILSKQAELANSGEQVDLQAIHVLETIAREPMSAAVIEAQLVSDSVEKICTLGDGLELIGEPALGLGCQFARMCTEHAQNILGPLLERLLIIEDKTIKDARLLANALVVATSKSQQEETADLLLIPGALYFLSHNHMPEMLYVCRKAKNARKAVLDAVKTTNSTLLARAIDAIWHHGLNPENLALLNDTALALPDEVWVLLQDYVTNMRSRRRMRREEN